MLVNPHACVVHQPHEPLLHTPAFPLLFRHHLDEPRLHVPNHFHHPGLRLSAHALLHFDIIPQLAQAALQLLS